MYGCYGLTQCPCLYRFCVTSTALTQTKSQTETVTETLKTVLMPRCCGRSTTRQVPLQWQAGR